MEPSASPSSRAFALLAGFAVVAWVGQALLFSSFVIDDSFISLRFARHLAEGQGIVWNVGEAPVEGFTSFLWVLLLALPHLVFGESTEWIARVGGVLCVLGLAGWLLRDLTARHGRFAALAAVVPLIAGTPYVINSVSGMETGVAILLSGLAHPFAVRGILDGDRRALGIFQVLAFLACLTRPDFALCYAVTIGAGYLIARRLPTGAELARVAGLFVLPGIIYFAWRWSYFGYFLPNPFYVKAGGIGTQSIMYVGSFVALFAAPASLLLVLGVFDERSRSRCLLALASFGAPVAAYLTVHPMMGVYWRFLIPYYALVPTAVAASVAVQSGWRLKGLVTAQALFSLSMLPLAGQYAQRAVGFTDVLRDLGAVLDGVDNTGKYHAAMNDVGIVPYFSQWGVLDTLGLCDDPLAHGEMTQEARISQVAPDVILLHDPPGRWEKYDLTAVEGDYRELTRIPYLRGSLTSDIVVYVSATTDVAEPLAAALAKQEFTPAKWEDSLIQSFYDALRGLYHGSRAEAGDDEPG